ncbi:hypothetical protein A0256_13570 [Mucilaginibacter sp. PAMC 26640]|nr:hypothetical protein A0256_13570 [Mucilaginibacter sp. PAMC 26640]
MKIKITLVVFTAILANAYFSCKKSIDVGPPKNQLEKTKVFTDSVSANSAIVGIYVDMMQNFGFSFTSGGLTAYPGLSADELSQTSNDPDLSQFYSNQINIRNSFNQVLWNSAYKFIYDANACIEGISGSPGISTSAKQKLMGEARQIRAFILFYLTNLYGPVPVVTTTDYRISQTQGRASADSVYSQIISDLTYAQANLPRNSSAKRASYYSATALLAKVQLYQKNYQEAENNASIVINSGLYKLEDNLGDVFLADSKEAIWKFLPVFPGIETWEGYSFVPSDPNAAPKYVLSDSLYNSFEPGDLRKSNWISISSVNGVSYPYPFKYKAGTTNGIATENYTAIRLAELYLIRAESRVNLYDLNGSIADINLIRTRSGLANTPGTDKTSLLLALEKERRSEMFCEWGNRWFDLQRTNRADAVLQPSKANWTHTDILYPIPDAEIKSNPALNQNAGY